MFVTRKELINQKLEALTADLLKEFAEKHNFSKVGNKGDLSKRLIEKMNETEIDHFIKQKYQEMVDERRKNWITDRELEAELGKVKDFSWGVVQGQLDQKIQREYVRVCCRYNELINSVEQTLHDEVTNYAIAAWYNHWSTKIVEDYISLHPKVVPTIKNIYGTDIFFAGQPFDLKITYLPKNYPFEKAQQDFKGLATWMYENQGTQRFGSDNRIFIILANSNNLNESWKLKRDFDLIKTNIDHFFSNETVTKKDEVVFNFDNKTHTAVTKVLLITK